MAIPTERGWCSWFVFMVTSELTLSPSGWRKFLSRPKRRVVVRQPRTCCPSEGVGVLTKVLFYSGLGPVALLLLVTVEPLHAQQDGFRSKWQVGAGMGYVAMGGLSDVAQGLVLNGFLADRLGPRVDLRVGVNVSGHGYSAVDVPGGERQLDFPLLGDPTYEFLTVYAGPVIWLRGSESRWAPYVGGTLSALVRLDGEQGGVGAGAVTGMRYWWSQSFGIELGLCAMLSRLRWASRATLPRHEWGQSVALTVGAVFGLGR